MSKSTTAVCGLPEPRVEHACATTTQLVHGAAAGDAAAWDALVLRYTNLLWSVARSHRLTEADASDVVQTSWLRLLENLGRIEDPERLPGWLVTTTRRECLRVLSRAGRELPTPVEDTSLELPDPAPPPDLGLLTDERDAELWRCFARLSERCQRLLRVLLAAEPVAYAEVSQAMGMPVGSIGPTRMRCLDRLRALTRAGGYSFEPATGGGLS
ncbi:RNA polymerase sigma factor (sigma-70 family) [Motilibacter peucedani]|uniref:RNA polymerase sigma factor (Sigma-70 family) n=1 Tax=Motilibacter peucedani TaxID=598650 RepID=A0A420XTT5_9ACTN|nr:sigma-70 family RNA polymerase sigma factor [Motilibacter peucedani]RKS80234.1 RNA polymerase sigma factor (sigma-70 family) [Motilibacter peucedani]